MGLSVEGLMLPYSSPFFVCEDTLQHLLLQAEDVVVLPRQPL